MKVIDLPIEPFEERYSAQWARWFASAYKAWGVRCSQIIPVPLADSRQGGAWLDPIITNHYKARQLAQVLSDIRDGLIGDGDVLFFHDLWFPGIEMLAYVRDTLGIKFKIAGCLHAGTWDPEDYLQRNTGSWSRAFEATLACLVDTVFVATNFHADLLRPRGFKQVCVTGFPIYPDFVPTVKGKTHAREIGLVVYPHRLDREKDPASFDRLASEPRLLELGYTFVRSRDVCKTKLEYYELLCRAEIVVSFALQETWGIAMQEGLFCGAIPFVPARLSYVEMYDRSLQHGSMTTLIRRLEYMAENREARQTSCQFRDAAAATRAKLIRAGAEAIPDMLRVLGAI